MERGDPVAGGEVRPATRGGGGNDDDTDRAVGAVGCPVASAGARRREELVDERLVAGQELAAPVQRNGTHQECATAGSNGTGR
jgi:hypothetical protein